MYHGGPERLMLTLPSTPRSCKWSPSLQMLLSLVLTEAYHKPTPERGIRDGDTSAELFVPLRNSLHHVMRQPAKSRLTSRGHCDQLHTDGTRLLPTAAACCWPLLHSDWSDGLVTGGRDITLPVAKFQPQSHAGAITPLPKLLVLHRISSCMRLAAT
jgi:hypothetical protein